MRALFVQIKCHLGRAYEVANAIADAEIASEIYSTAGEFDLLVKFYLLTRETLAATFGVSARIDTVEGQLIVTPQAAL